MNRYFSDTLNVLTNIGKVNELPFPFVETTQCFPDDVYDLLAATRPLFDDVICRNKEDNNRRIDLSGTNLLDNEFLHPLWKDFISYHTSHSFYLKILDKFEAYFLQFYPHLKNMRDYKTAIRYSEEEADIYLECQISYNSPVKEKSTVNKPHVDNPLELWASLLYMKDPDDNAGGDLVLHECKEPPRFHKKRHAYPECLTPFKTIYYAPNTYVGFVNSPISIHSVTEREVTDKARLMVNLSLEFVKKGKELFSVQV